MRNLLSATVRKLVTVIFAPRVLWQCWSGMRAQWHKVAKADVIVIGGGGFGFTVIFPDAARRLYGAGKSCILFFGPHGRYNPIFAEMFPDIGVIIVPFDAFVRVAGRKIGIEYATVLEIGYAMLGWVIKTFMGKRVVDWHLGMHKELPYPDIATMPGGRGRLSAEMHRENGFPRYYQLRRDVAAPPIRLPETQRAIVDAALARQDERVGKPMTKTCCLYTRQKGGKANEWDAFVRSGSQLEDYEPSIAYLTARGYRVFVMGDIKLPPAMADRFDGMLVDAVRLGVDGGLFAAYAATEGDFFLGEAGGGVDPPMGADRPCLLVNWLQYYAVVPYATHYYKHLRGPDGKILPPSELFGRFGWDLHYEGYDVLTNTSEEILAAVKDFVSRLETGQPLGLTADVLGKTWPDLWFHFADKAYISPAWLDLFAKGQDGAYSVPATCPHDERKACA